MSSIRKLESTRVMQALMRDYYIELDRVARERERPVAWCSSVGPAELLLALGFEVYFPENHAAMLGAGRLAAATIPAALAEGFSPDICSYLTADVGAFLGDRSALGESYGIRPPRPDLLVFNSNQCYDIQNWFGWYGRRFSVPVLGVHSPRFLTEVGEAEVAGVREEFLRLERDLLDAFPHRRRAAAGLEETLALSAEASGLWREALELSRSRPSPWTFFDHSIHMAPIVVLRGRPEAVEYYRGLLEELKSRVASGEGALPRERHRLYWEGMPIWGKLRSLAETMIDLDCATVVSTYCNSWILEDLAHPDPYTGQALAYTRIFINRSELAKEDIILRLLEDYGVDGIVFHNAKTCPWNSNCRYGMMERVSERSGLPALALDGDVNDLRFFSPEQTRTSLEAFSEQLGAWKVSE